MKLYYKGEGTPVDAHPSKVDEMKKAGWTEAPKTTKKRGKK